MLWGESEKCQQTPTPPAPTRCPPSGSAENIGACIWRCLNSLPPPLPILPFLPRITSGKHPKQPFATMTPMLDPTRLQRWLFTVEVGHRHTENIAETSLKNRIPLCLSVSLSSAQDPPTAYRFQMEGTSFARDSFVFSFFFFFFTPSFQDPLSDICKSMFPCQ